MIGITVTAEAYAAIKATLPAGNSAPWPTLSNRLCRRVVDRLRALRGRGESYSQVILRLAE
jgi:hypothetical protein